MIENISLKWNYIFHIFRAEILHQIIKLIAPVVMLVLFTIFKLNSVLSFHNIYSGPLAGFSPILMTEARELMLRVWVDRYAFFRADTDYYRPSRPITDILNRYMSGVKMTINVKIKNNKGSDKNCLPWCWLHFLLLSSSMHPSTIRVI